MFTLNYLIMKDCRKPALTSVLLKKIVRDDGMIKCMNSKQVERTEEQRSWQEFLSRHSGLLATILVVLAAALVFALRYPPAFTEPNFYAEDGMVFVQGVYDKNPIETITTAFNGYLVVGQYLLAEGAVGTVEFIHLPFWALPTVIAVLSCLFLGLTVSLPYIFLRKHIGTKVSLAIVLLGAFMPLPGSDYAIIGTIGNLKFAFLYWAFILVLFRCWNAHDTKKTLLADVLLLFSVLTYAPAVALLPVATVPYLKEMWARLKKRDLTYLKKPEILSLMSLALVSLTYVVVVYIHEVPKMPGYLDTPYNTLATVKTLFRSTLYGILFFVAPALRDSIVLLLFTGVVALGIHNKKTRWIVLLACWASAVATVSFVLNRPGVSEFMLKYGKTPDQFFYAQSLVFMFALVWLAKQYLGRLKQWALPASVAVLASFVALSLLYGGSSGKNAEMYRSLGTVEHNVREACRNDNGGMVLLQIYPSDTWRWKLPRERVCR